MRDPSGSCACQPQPQPHAPRRRRAPRRLPLLLPLLIALLLLLAAAAPRTAAQGLAKDQRPDLGAGGTYSQLRHVYTDAEQIRRMYRERSTACAQRGGGSLCTGPARDQLSQMLSTVSGQQGGPQQQQQQQAGQQQQQQQQQQQAAQQQAPPRELAAPSPGGSPNGRRLLRLLRPPRAA